VAPGIASAGPPAPNCQVPNNPELGKPCLYVGPYERKVFAGNHEGWKSTYQLTCKLPYSVTVVYPIRTPAGPSYRSVVAGQKPDEWSCLERSETGAQSSDFCIGRGEPYYYCSGNGYAKASAKTQKPVQPAKTPDEIPGPAVAKQNQRPSKGIQRGSPAWEKARAQCRADATFSVANELCWQNIVDVAAKVGNAHDTTFGDALDLLLQRAKDSCIAVGNADAALTYLRCVESDNLLIREEEGQSEIYFKKLFDFKRKSHGDFDELAEVAQGVLNQRFYKTSQQMKKRMAPPPSSNNCDVPPYCLATE
jgi:hypothetical protein